MITNKSYKKANKNSNKKFNVKKKSTKMPITRVIDFVTADANQSVMQQYRDISGLDRPLDDIVSSNVSYLEELRSR